MNLSIMIKKGLLFLVILLCGLNLNAQQSYKYQSTVKQVDSDGFYAINLLPDFISKCKSDFSDVRLNDAINKPVPYLFGSQLLIKDQKKFILFPEIKQNFQPDSVTVFIAENKVGTSISQLYLKLRNTAVQRTVNLSGSDDLKNWYAIKENIRLADAEVASSGDYEQSLNFPVSSYHYLKVQIGNKSKEPVAILQAGIYKDQTFVPQYLQVNVSSFTQKDTLGISYITIRFNDAYQINKLHFDILGVKYFKRLVRIFQLNDKVREQLTESELTSEKVPDIYFSAKAKTIEFEITNGDNPALTIKSISAFQSEQSIVAYLLKGKTYQLICGNEKAIAPLYDLQYFKGSIYRQLNYTDHGKVIANPQYHIGPPAQQSAYPWLIWIAISIAIGVLTLLTFKMIKEVNKRPSDHKSI